MSQEMLPGFQNMVIRLNVFGELFHTEKEHINNKEVIYRVMFCAYPKGAEVLIIAIENDEYMQPVPHHDGHFDIKLGYSCNNNCLHCVIKPNLKHAEECGADIAANPNMGLWCSWDLKFDNVVKQLMSAEVYNSNSITLTGGEPTIRKDFIEILRWLYFNRPDKCIGLQTNGRRLSDINLVKKIRRFSRQINFVIAIHGSENVHNLITNTRVKGNPFRDTVQGILNLQQVFGNDLSMRTEMVLSNYNLCDVLNSIKFQHEELRITKIGVSYPHLEGYCSDQIKELAPKMKELITILKEIAIYMEEHEDLEIMLEEIPSCVLNQASKNHRFINMGGCKEKTIVAYLSNTVLNHYDNWKQGHVKNEKCTKCSLFFYCDGVWKESLALNEDALIPLP
jgi:MoaA/NifB/PqqE/SkfB family radical SAM enzyme